MLHAGELFGGRFRLIRPIGVGGMASVWWAHHELIGRDVALKLAPVSRDPQAVGRFLREARIIGRFRHRNIVGVVDAGELEEEGLLFLAMELLQGAPLSARFADGQPLPAEEIVPTLIEVCRGLEAAHAEGVVHRDIKPENIFLAEVTGDDASMGCPASGWPASPRVVVPKILDFGVSRLEGSRDALTLDGELLGTPCYMSPEQALGRISIDARVDLWAIGVILYEALLGRPPFHADQPYAVLRRIVDDEPDPMPESIDPRLRAIVERCLQKDPAQRHPDAAALRTELEAALSVPPWALAAGAPAPGSSASGRLAELWAAALRLWPSGKLPRPRTSTTLGLAGATALVAALASGAPYRGARAGAEAASSVRTEATLAVAGASRVARRLSAAAAEAARPWPLVPGPAPDPVVRPAPRERTGAPAAPAASGARGRTPSGAARTPTRITTPGF